ncbi:MAG: prephenate dehydrogenase [Clostridiaceae bacterium]|nr:prephenate dehydrogenase [Clostridiaceae bacterium]
MEDDNFSRNIAVVGLGLIGGSYSMALRQLKVGRIFGIDIDESVLDKAVSCGVIDEGGIDAEAILCKSDMVIIALYPQDTIEFIKNNARYFNPGTIITDTCGIKQPIIDAAERYLPKNVEFIGGHPMAGNEFQGFDSASRELFFNTNYIITPHESNSEKGIMAVEKLAAAIGCKCVTRIEAEAHDRMISFTSQLPHIVAILFANLVTGEKDMSAFTGRSFKDATRVAALNKELWTQIFRMNNLNIIDRIEDMEEMLHKLKNAITAQDESSLGILLDNSIKGKREIG